MLPSITLYVRKDGEKLQIVVLYVDDLLIAGPDEQEIADFNADLSKMVLTDLGHLHYYLSIQFITVEGGIFLSQRKYIEKLLQ